jgi:glycosyltransferase involved in cell wall biosynthesis
MVARSEAAGVDIRLDIAGDGPEMDWVRRAVADLRNAERVRLLGSLDDVATFLAGVDVLIMPSHNEGLPYALLEAMAAGCAIVASDVGGIPEVVQNGVHGRLVPPRDVERLGEVVAELAGDPAGVRRMGRAASEHAVASFGLEDGIDQLRRLYHEALAGSRT